MATEVHEKPIPRIICNDDDVFGKLKEVESLRDQLNKAIEELGQMKFRITFEYESDEAIPPVLDPEKSAR